MSTASDQAVGIVLARFRDLEPGEQLLVYREVRDYLGARIRLGSRDALVEARAESLDVMRQVAAHLRLTDGQLPTPTQFDATCRELNLPWNRSRFTRAWGRWRFGKEAFAGVHHDTAARRNLFRAVDDRRVRCEAPLRALQMWLATNPPDRTAKTYRRWAGEYNAQIAHGEVPVSILGYHMSRSLGLTWVDAVRYAAAEIGLAEAAKPRERLSRNYCRGPYDLVAMSDVQAILGRSRSEAYREVHNTEFPVPVLSLSGARLWLRTDVEAYAAGRSTSKREANELRHHYLTVPEICNATGLTLSKLRTRRGAPTPAVLMHRVRLWLRREVDDWVAETSGKTVG